MKSDIRQLGQAVLGHLLFQAVFPYIFADLSAVPGKAQASKNPSRPAGGQKEKGGLGEMNFCPLANTAPKARSGWEAARSCVSKEAKPAKIVSLIEKDFCARPLKEKEIFAGFACPAVSGASRWAGSAPAVPHSQLCCTTGVRAQIVAQRKFGRHSVIAARRSFRGF